MTKLSRRDLLRVLGGAAAAAGVGVPLVGGIAGASSTGTLVPSRLTLPRPFQRPLPIPPTAAPTSTAQGLDRYAIVQRPGTAEMLPGVATPVWGYDGRFPGPTLRTRSGRPVIVRHRNELPVPTVVHLHGGHTPAESDGFPTDLLHPAGTDPLTAHADHGMDPLARIAIGARDHHYPMRQRAATLWYHDHRMDFTGPDVWRGLAGFHIVTDDEDERLPLPRGDRDVPLMIADRSFAADGSLAYPDPAGRAADGSPGYPDPAERAADGSPGYPDPAERAADGSPGYPDPAERAADGSPGYPDPAERAADGSPGYPDPAERAADGSPGYPDPAGRAADGSPGHPDPAGRGAGVLGDVILVNGVAWPFHEVGGARYRLRLLNASNARRYRLVLDPPAPFVQIGTDGGLLEAPIQHDAIEMAPAQRFDVVVDFGRYPPGTRVRLINTFGAGTTRDVLQFRVGGRAGDDTEVPAVLSAARPGQPPVRTRTFRFRHDDVHGMPGWTINGAPFDPAVSIASPRLGETEVWRLTSDFHHPVHLHLAPFRVLSRGAGGPGPYDHGWKDTIDLRPAEQASLLVRFDDYAGRFVLHCHNLEHEDMAMMATFTTA